jgi:HK97 family phage portal protein
MGLLALFKGEKKPRYPRERVLPADVLGGSINNACLTDSNAMDFFSYPGNPSGYPVTDTTAMRVAAVYACVEKISVIAGLPKHIYESNKTSSGRIDHDYWPLINTQPTENWTAASMWEREIQSMLLRGDGVARLIRQGRSGKITEIVPYTRENVAILRGSNGKIAYRFTDPYTRKQDDVKADDVLHIPGFGFNGFHGMSVIQYAAHSGIGIALSADQYSSEFFANSARPDYLLTTDGTLNAQQQEKTRQVLEERHTGIGNRHKPLILQGGLKIMPISMTSEDAQLLQTREFETVNICIAFGVPPQLIGVKDSSAGWAGSSLEQLNLGFAKYCLKGHITRIEQELNRKLFSLTPKYFVKINLDAFLEGDSKTQAEYFSRALGGPGQQGFMAVDEVRKLKNLPPTGNKKFETVIESGQKTNTGSDNAPTPP